MDFPHLAAYLSVASGLALLLYGVWHIASAYSSAEWPTVTGRIVNRQVHERSGVEGETQYEAEVRYRYTVAGQEYVSTRRQYGARARSASRGGALRSMDGYAVDDPVLVYHNPDSPKEAVLEPGLNASLLTFVIAGAGFIAAGIYVLRRLG